MDRSFTACDTKAESLCQYIESSLSVPLCFHSHTLQHTVILVFMFHYVTTLPYIEIKCPQ